MKKREAYVSGKFYPSDKIELINMIKDIYEKEKMEIKEFSKEINIIGGIVPHAGYIFSGYQAVHFFDIISKNNQKYDTIIIINPCHTGYGEDISLDSNDSWKTPLGEVFIDKEFSCKLNFKENEEAHKYEHSGEVMLPFLQYFLNYDFKILPITLKKQNYINAKIIADELKRVNEILGKKILIVASSDFSHYVSPEYGEEMDNIVIDSIMKFNSKKIYEDVQINDLSICGFGPIMVLLEYAKDILTETNITLLKKGNSGEIIPSNEVVDYYSFLVYE